MNSSPEEAQIIKEMVDLFLTAQEKSFQPGKVARRALHGKSLGTVRAEFKVRQLAQDLQVGLFSEAKTFDALIRFSNGGLSEKAPDLLPNVRGMALKILNVPGEKILPDGASEQDFIMANYPTFFVSNARQMLQLFQGKILPVLIAHPEIPIKAIDATVRVIHSLLDLKYYSQMPHLFNGRPCKYSLFPQTNKSGQGQIKNNYFDKDYLRHNLSERLKENAGQFVFCVQFQLPGESISDPTLRWRGEYIPLADVTIMQGNQALKESEGEELSFNPTRSLAEHCPIEWPARMRLAVYQADFAWRATKNGNGQLT